MNIRQLAHAFIRDKNNNVAIWQYPNPPIIGWFVCAVAAHFFRMGNLHTGLATLGTTLLFVWAYLEISQGASYFRRVLGLVVALTIAVRYFG